MRWLLIAILALPLARAEWRYYGGDAGSSRFSSLKEINKGNVARLKVAWTYHTGDKADRGRSAIETTPVIIDGVLYGLCSPPRRGENHDLVAKIYRAMRIASRS